MVVKSDIDIGLFFGGKSKYFFLIQTKTDRRMF